jgi:hypothetical protein
MVRSDPLPFTPVAREAAAYLGMVLSNVTEKRVIQTMRGLGDVLHPI